MNIRNGAVCKALRRFSAAALTVCAAVLGTALPAAAAPALPFQLNAPAAVSVKWQPTDETPSACVVSYVKDSELTAYMKHDTDERLAIRQQYGYSELWIKGQLDWSLDSPNDWHYNRYWDTDGYDTEWKQHLGDWAYLNFAVTSAKIDSEEIFRSMGNPADASDSQWNGTAEAPGWKSVLKEGQYELFTAPDGKKGAKIDLTKHQIYVRMRWLVMVNRDDWEREQYVCSGWSQTASVGTLAAATSAPADTAETTAVTTQTLPELAHLSAPDVRDLHLTGDFSAEGRAVAEFTLQVPEEVSDSAERIKAAGGKLILAAAAETDGADSSPVIPLEEIPLTPGERRVTFSLPECTRCSLSWYYCLEVTNPQTGEPVRTAQSDGTKAQELDVPVQTTQSTGTTASASAPKKKSAGRIMRRTALFLLLMAALAGGTVFFMRKYHISIRRK